MRNPSPKFDLNALFAGGAHKDVAKQLAAHHSFNARIRRPNLTYVRGEEPEGWPLTRPATRNEWSHVLRVMIVRRIPESGPIHRGKLIAYVHDDLTAASDAGRIYVESDFIHMRSTQAELDRLISKARVAKSAPRMADPDVPYVDEAIYRTEHADGWLNHVPRVVQAVVDFLPTTSVLDLMVQALVDAAGADRPSQPPSSSSS